LISTYNADRRPWNGVCYEFLDVIAEVENSVPVAPGSRFRLDDHPDSLHLAELTLHLALRTYSGVRKAVLGQHAPKMQATVLDEHYDLTFYMCQFIREIHEVGQIRGWRERSGFAAIFILESWSSTFETYRKDLRLLDKFDHVFVLNGSCIDNLRRYTSTPITQLSTGINCLQSTPVPDFPERTIDITSLGRRIPDVHTKILELAEREKLFYYHDVWKGIWAENWRAVRSFNASIIKRSRFYLVWDPKTANPTWGDLLNGENALSTRYFEGSAGGAILLGTVPECPEFDAQFDWPDAVIELTDDPGEIIQELKSDPQRMDGISRRNMANSLRKHDWIYRWQQVLEIAGHTATRSHEERIRALGRMAFQVESQKHMKKMASSFEECK
jgi:hypothetical protein